MPKLSWSRLSVFACTLILSAAASAQTFSGIGCVGGNFADPLVIDDPDASPFGLKISDPCGLRASDLSGVWGDVGQARQYVIVHDPATGAFAVRFLYLAPDDELRHVHGHAFGDVTLSGRIHTDGIAIKQHTRDPSLQATCPEHVEHYVPQHAIELGFLPHGARYITLAGHRRAYERKDDCAAPSRRDEVLRMFTEELLKP